MKIKTLICLMLMLIAMQAFSQKREVAKALAQPRAMGEYYHYNCNKRGILVRYFNRYTRKHPEYIMGDTKTNYVKCYGGLSNAVVEIDILPKSEYDAYVCEKMTSHRKTDFTKSATVYAKNMQGWTKYTDVSWCGDVKNGMPDGKGAGFKKDGDNYFAFSGTFYEGAPLYAMLSEYNCTEPAKHFDTQEYDVTLSLTEYLSLSKAYPVFAQKYEDYACKRLTGHPNSFASTGSVYIKEHDTWLSLSNAKWSGTVKNGKVHGYGYGYARVGDKIYAFDGTFDEGILDGPVYTKYFNGVSDIITETSSYYEFLTLTALLKSQPQLSSRINAKRRALYDKDAQKFMTCFNGITRHLANHSPKNFERTISGEQIGEIDNAIKTMQPYIDNNYDYQYIKNKIDILEALKKVDEGIAYRYPTRFIDKTSGLFGTGLFARDIFNEDAATNAKSRIEGYMSDNDKLDEVVNKERTRDTTLNLDSFVWYVLGAGLIFDDKYSGFVTAYNKEVDSWNEMVRSRRSSSSSSSSSSSYSSSSSSSSSYSKSDPKYWQNKIGSKIKFVTSYIDGDQGLFGNNVDLIVEGYLKEVEDGFADWYYHVDVTKITIEEGWLDSSSNSGDRKVLYKAQNEWLGKVTEFAEDDIRDMDEL